MVVIHVRDFIKTLKCHMVYYSNIEEINKEINCQTLAYFKRLTKLDIFKRHIYIFIDRQHSINIILSIKVLSLKMSDR